MKNDVKEQDNLSRNAIIYTVGNFLNRAVTILSSPIFTRLLSTHEFGRVTVYMTWVGVFNIFTGLELRGSLANAYIDYGKKNYKAYSKTCISLSILVTSLLIFITTLLKNQLEVVFDLEYHLLILAILHSFFNNNVLYLSNHLSILKKAMPFVFISFGQLISNVLLSIFIIIYSGWNPAISRIYGEFWSNAVFGIIICIFFIWNKEKIFDFRYLKYGLILSVPLMFHSLGGVVLSGSDKLMLSRIADDSIAGIYSFAVSVTGIISSVSISFNTAWVPYLYETLKKRQFYTLEERIDKYLSCYTFVACGFLLVMPEMVKLLADKAYWDCIPLVIPLTIGEYFRFLYFFPANYELYNKRNQWVALATTITGLINIGLNVLWIPKWGMYGATLSTVLSYVLSFIFHELVARRVIGNFFLKISVYSKYMLIFFATSISAWLFLQATIIRWIFAFIYGLILLKLLLINKKLF